MMMLSRCDVRLYMLVQVAPVSKRDEGKFPVRKSLCSSV
jgi:hypothetical protein